MKKLYLLFVLLIIGGCAQSTYQWQYIEEFPMYRRGNTYVANVRGHNVRFIEVSTGLKYNKSSNENGLHVDEFSNEEETAFAVVFNELGIFTDKIRLAEDPNRYVINDTQSGNKRYVTIVADAEEYGSIHLVMIISDKLEGGWLNAFATYLEHLPHYYSFKSWKPSVLDEDVRKKFIVDFEQRGHEAI